ncbi:bolA-like protein DDB_G0274169 [Cimex lectularius]|uniref:BolA n=1 Tax=Cimex lectularius TaxID=79782 RepID=A0A8I6TI02_CIMLE|nr:bolA-like protein DDB_G0274169 [Cimex lectularius]
MSTLLKRSVKLYVNFRNSSTPLSVFRHSRPELRNIRDTRVPMENPVETAMVKKLTDAFQPKYLEVINESSRHGVPKGSETHFKVVVVSSQFEDVNLLQRHRMVNKVLDEEINGPVHALSIVAKTPNQWEESDKTVEPSPNCKGGFGK